MGEINVIKRSGEEVTFDPAKIVNAISKANDEVAKRISLNPTYINVNVAGPGFINISLTDSIIITIKFLFSKRPV